MHQDPIDNIINLKKQIQNKFLSTIIIGNILAVLTSTFANYFSEYSLEIILGLIIALISILIITAVRTKSKSLNINTKINTFFIYKKKEILYIPRYDLSWDMCSNMKALFAEMSNEKKMWGKEELSFFDYKDQTKNNFCVSLIKENIEYCVLDKLSTTLTDFFNSEAAKTDKYDRESIPDLISKNRFLNVFSRDMQERDVFVSHKRDKKAETPGKTILAIGKNGEKYDNFDLILPKNSKIQKTDDGFIISTSVLTLKIQIILDGYSCVLPHKFEQLYLNQPNEDFFSDRNKVYMARIEVNVEFKFWKSLFYNLKQTHQWVDKFIGRLKKSYSKECFFEKIDWEHNLFLCERYLKIVLKNP